MEYACVADAEKTAQEVSGEPSQEIDDLLASQEGGVNVTNLYNYLSSGFNNDFLREVEDFLASHNRVVGDTGYETVDQPSKYKHPVSRIVEGAEQTVRDVLKMLKAGGDNLTLAQLVEAGIQLDIAMTIVSTAQKAWTNLNQMMQKAVQ